MLWTVWMLVAPGLCRGWPKVTKAATTTKGDAMRHVIHDHQWREYVCEFVVVSQCPVYPFLGVGVFDGETKSLQGRGRWSCLDDVDDKVRATKIEKQQNHPNQKKKQHGRARNESHTRADVRSTIRPGIPWLLCTSSYPTQQMPAANCKFFHLCSCSFFSIF